MSWHLMQGKMPIWLKCLIEAILEKVKPMLDCLFPNIHGIQQQCLSKQRLKIIGMYNGGGDALSLTDLKKAEGKPQATCGEEGKKAAAEFGEFPKQNKVERDEEKRSEENFEEVPLLDREEGQEEERSDTEDDSDEEDPDLEESMMQAISQGNKRKIKMLVSTKFAIPDMDIAGKKGKWSIAQWMHKMFSKRCRCTSSIVIQALSKKNWVEVEWLLENRPGAFDYHALKWALKGGHLEAIELLLKLGFEIDWAAMTEAITKGRLKVATYLGSTVSIRNVPKQSERYCLWQRSNQRKEVQLHEELNICHSQCMNFLSC